MEFDPSHSLLFVPLQVLVLPMQVLFAPASQVSLVWPHVFATP